MQKLNYEKLRSNIEKRADGNIAEGKVGGCSVIVRQNGQVVYKNCFGVKVPGTDEKLTEDTLFRMASMTKPITAAAILIQMSRGLVKLDDPVEKFIPGYADMKIGKLDENRKVVVTGDAKEKVRVLHLLTHSSGVGTLEVGDAQFGMMKPEDMQTLKTVTDYHANTVLAFEPFTAQFYSPVVGFDVLARIVEITSGKTYDKFLKEELFEPLGMADSTFQPTEEQWGRMITMHNRVDGKSVICPFPDHRIFGNFPLTYFCGGAGLASTLNDYSKFAEMLLNEGKTPDGRQLIKPELIKEMRTAQLPREIMGDPQVWGLGVRVITNDTYKRLPTGSFGWSGAYGTHFWVDPENKITAVYLKNSGYDGGSGALTAAEFEEDVTYSLE